MRVNPDQINPVETRAASRSMRPARSGRWARAWQAAVGLGFHLLYHQLAWTYDAVSWVASLGQWRAWQLTVLEEVRGTAVLELGHGPGHMLVHLAGAGYQVSGIDPSPQMGRLAARRLRRAGLTARLARSTAQELPFASGQFDTVFATFPTAYILDPRTLTAVHRVLASGGRLLILPEARLTGRGLPDRLLERLYRLTGQRGSASPADTQAAMPANWSPFKDSLASAGFNVSIAEVRLAESAVTVVRACKIVA